MMLPDATFHNPREVLERYFPAYCEELKRSKETEEERNARLSQEITAPLIRSLREALSKIEIKKI